MVKAEPNMETPDWRTQLNPNSRQRIVAQIMETFKKTVPTSGSDGLLQQKKIAERLEQNIFIAATTESDYLQKATTKIISLSVPLNSAGGCQNPQDPASHTMQSQVPKQAKSQIPLPNPPHARQQLLPLSSNLSSVMTQNSGDNSVGQDIPSNALPSSPGNMKGSQDPPRVVSQQQKHQSQISQQFMDQKQQFPNQILKQKQLPQGNIEHSVAQSHIQKQPKKQQENLLQQTQPSVMQSASPCCPQQTQHSTVAQTTSSVVQQHQQPQQTVNQQTPVLRQQRTSMSLPVMPLQSQLQPHQLMNAPNLQENQLLGQQHHQNNRANLQHHQPVQLPGVPNKKPQWQQENFGTGTQCDVPNKQPSQQPMHIKVQQEQNPQTSLNMSQIQGHHEQSQPVQQQVMSQHQSQPTQRQQQLPPQPNPLQGDMKQCVQASGSSMLNPQNAMDQKPVFHSQRTLPEASSTQTGDNAVDWREEAYQKIKSMREKYLPVLSELHRKISFKLHQHESLAQPQKSEQIDLFKNVKTRVENFIKFLNLPKDKIGPVYAEKLPNIEKDILYILNKFLPRKPFSSQQQIQPPGGHPLSKQQQHQQQLQSQIPQLQQQHNNQMKSHMQPAILQNSASSMPSTSVTGMSHGPMPPPSNHVGVSMAQTNTMNSMQPGSAFESGQGNRSSSLQQVGVESLQQSSVNVTEQANVNTMPQSGANGLQPNINSQIKLSTIQHSHLKQQHQQQYQMHQQLNIQKQQQQRPQQKQQLQQFAHQSQKPLQSSQLQAHLMPQLHQMDADLKVRQGMGFKPGTTATDLRTASNHQLKADAISSPQLLQVASPQSFQQSSPQIDQPNLLPYLNKIGTPLRSANSNFTVPSPSTPLARPPIPGDPERQTSGVSTLSNAENIGQPQNIAALAQVQPLAVGTSGISASPLLAEFTSTDGNQVTGPNVKSSVTEQPLERLVKVVKSVSPKVFSASVSDIGSVIDMIDMIAGSPPGTNGSRAAGEDLVAMTKCRTPARNFAPPGGSSATKKMKRHITAMPLDAMSSAGSLNDSFSGLESSDLESTVTSRGKRPRFEANYVLLEEIRELNQRLIDTVVDISDEVAVSGAAEGGEGTIVKCSFNGVALCSDLKSQYASAQMSLILPLRLLVPTNYPNCSPILLAKFPAELSKGTEDLSAKAKSRFGLSLRSLSQPMSLKEMVRTWDMCARAVISDYAQQRGGGSFSSRYGSWENCVSAT